MARSIQITVDSAAPRRLAEFWCEVFAIVDPDGVGPRVFFLKVPETKTAKNRMHLDVHVAADELHARAAELVELGATHVAEFDEPEGHWITMRDPEGNEFCLQ